MLELVIVMAAATSTSFDPMQFLYGFGPLGIIVALYITDYIPSRGQLRDQKERFQEQLADKDEIIADKDETIRKQDVIISMFLQQGQQAVPALVRTAQVIENLPKAIPVPAELDEVKSVMPRLYKVLERLENQANEPGGERS